MNKQLVFVILIFVLGSSLIQFVEAREGAIPPTPAYKTIRVSSDNITASNSTAIGEIKCTGGISCIADWFNNLITISFGGATGTTIFVPDTLESLTNVTDNGCSLNQVRVAAANATWVCADQSGAGGGEANTASNIGAGVGVFQTKVGVDLVFHSLLAGSGITISDIGDELRINSTATGGNATVLTDLGDVDLIGPSSSQFLRYNGTYWVNTTVTVGNATNLDDLGDVVITSPAYQHVMIYNGSVWVNRAFSINNQTVQNDFQIVGINNQTGVITTNQFSVNNQTVSNDFQIVGINNVTGDITRNQFSVNTVTCSGQFVSAIDNATGDVICTTASGSGNATVLDELGDVQIQSPTANQFLRYNGTYWNNTSVTIGNASALNDLSDVAFDGTPLVNNILQYNGSQWTNKTAPSGSGSGGIIPASFIISVNGSNYQANNGTSGLIVYSDPSADTVIQNTINALSNGGLIFIKAGTYPLTTGITISNNNIQLHGEGKSTILTVAVGIDGITITANDIVINSLYINGANSGTGDNIFISSGNRITISNNYIDNGYHAIQKEGSTSSRDIKITNNQLVNASRFEGAIGLFQSGNTNTLDNVEISYNTILNPQFHGIQVYGNSAPMIQNVKIIGNIVDTPKHAGIFVSRVNNTLIEGNTVLNTPCEGLDAEGSNGVIFNANYISNSTCQSITAFPIGTVINTDIIVSNNIINQTTGSTANGIWMDTVNGLVISGNKIDTWDDGIQVLNNLSTVLIGNNVVNNTSGSGSYGIRVDLGVGKTADSVLIAGNVVRNYDNNIGIISGTVTNLIVQNNEVSAYNVAGITTSGSTITNKMVRNNLGFGDTNDTVTLDADQTITSRKIFTDNIELSRGADVPNSNITMWNNQIKWSNVKIYTDLLRQILITTEVQPPTSAGIAVFPSWNDILEGNNVRTFLDLANSNDTTNYEKLRSYTKGNAGFYIDAQSGGTGINRPLAIQLNGSSKITLNTNGTVSMGSDLNLNNSRITLLGTPTENTDAQRVNKFQLHDLTIGDCINGSQIEYQTSNSTWICGTDANSGGNATVLKDLGDVDYAGSAPLTNNVLQYNGTHWTNATIAGGGNVTNLNDAGDVVITSPLDDNFLRYNGVQWINEAVSFLTAAITSINGDTTAAQIIAAQSGNTTVTDAGATHTVGIGENIMLRNLQSQNFSKAINFTSGSKLSLTPNATFAGLGLGLLSADPTNRVAGDIWLTTNQIVYQSTIGRQTVVDLSLGQALSNKQLDTTNRINDNTDTTKRFNWLLSGMTTGTTLTLRSNQTTSQGLNFPNVNSSDIIAVLGLPQAFVNKTIIAGQNNLTDTGATLGDLLKHNGTQYVNFAKGTGSQQIRVNAGGTDLEYFTPSAGSGNATRLNELGDVALDADQAPETNDVLTFNGTHWTNGTSAAGASDRIFEGDSEVEVIDLGTGFVEVGVDGGMDYNFTGEYLNMTTNELNFKNNSKPATPSAGNIQIYAMNSTNNTGSSSPATLYAIDDLGFNHTLQDMPRPFFKKMGLVTPAVVAGADGLFGGTLLDGSETTAVDNTFGGHISTTTGVTIGNDAGIRTAGGLVWEGGYGIYLDAKIQLQGAGGYETFIGFNSDVGTGALAGINAFCNNDSCFGFGIKGDTHTTWQFVRNDGDSTTDFQDTGIANSTSTSVRLQMWSDPDNNSRWCGRINDSTIQCFTTEVPAPTTALGVITSIATTDITSDTFRYYYVYSESRK